MEIDVSVLLRRVEGINAAISKLDEGTETLSRGMTMLRRHTPVGFTQQHQLMESMDSAIDRMLVAHGMLHDSVSKLLPSSGHHMSLDTASTPLDAVINATATISIVLSAMEMLVSDIEGIKKLSPLQREVFSASYNHIMAVSETLLFARKELQDKKHQ